MPSPSGCLSIRLSTYLLSAHTTDLIFELAQQASLINSFDDKFQTTFLFYYYWEGGQGGGGGDTGIRGAGDGGKKGGGRG